MPKHTGKLTQKQLDKHYALKNLEWEEKHLAERLIESAVASLLPGVDPSEKTVDNIIRNAKKVAKTVIEKRRKDIKSGKAVPAY